jgi:hypothetical protein
MKGNRQLFNTIDYVFVGHREEFDREGRLLVWVATVEGAFSGRMKWWSTADPPAPVYEQAGAVIAFYSARWEISSDDRSLLAGESAGKTVFPQGADGIWDGHGVVTEAQADLEALIDRRIHETGSVIVGSNPPLSYAGHGIFVIS